MVILDILEFDIIIGMACFSPHHSILDCNAKIVTLVILRMDRTEWEGDYRLAPVKLISFIYTKRFVGKECSTLLDHFLDTSIEVPSFGSVFVVCEF